MIVKIVQIVTYMYKKCSMLGFFFFLNIVLFVKLLFAISP